MPKSAKETPTRWPLPGHRYGYVERNAYGVAVLRYKGRRLSLGVAFEAGHRKRIITSATKMLEGILKEEERERKNREREGVADTAKVPTATRAEKAFRRDRNVAEMPRGAQYEFDAMFNHFFPVDFRLTDDAMHDHLSERLAELRRTLAPNTLALYTGRLNTFLRYCRYRKWLTVDPWDGGLLRPRRQKPEKKTPLSDAQIFGMYRYCLRQRQQRYREVAALLQLLNATGMRISEAFSLYWRDAVEDTTGVNTIDSDRITLRHTKNGAREIPYGSGTAWTEQIERAIRRLCRMRRARHVPQRGTKVRPTDRAFRLPKIQVAQDCIREAFDAAGVETGHLKSHLFRTTLKQRWIERGVTKDTAVMIIGHTVETSDRHYATEQRAEDVLRELHRDTARGVARDTVQ